jgi:hypothetical protein
MNSNPTSRVATRLLDRRWALLAAEFALLVVGILIALAIDDWANARNDRVSERIYLELLVRDLKHIEIDLLEQIEYEDAVAKLSVKTHAKISSGVSEADAQIIGGMLSALAGRRTIFLESAAFEDLTSTGNLGLIRDRDLRDHIVQAFSKMGRLEVVMEKNNREYADEGFSPFLRNHGVSYRNSPHDPSGSGEFTAVLESYLSEEMLNPDDDVLLLPNDAREWRAVEKELTWRAFSAIVMLDTAKVELESAISIREEIESHLAE